MNQGTPEWKTVSVSYNKITIVFVFENVSGINNEETDGGFLYWISITV